MTLKTQMTEKITKKYTLLEIMPHGTTNTIIKITLQCLLNFCCKATHAATKLPEMITEDKFAVTKLSYLKYIPF
jgi:hypothetical protein